MIAPLTLSGFWIWEQCEEALSRRNLAAYKPVPTPATCAYTSDQVSVIVCTVDTLLARCLRTWLANNPLEIVIVTIPQHLDRIRSVVANAAVTSEDSAKITVLASSVKGKRAQMDVGIRAANGFIIATVDDHIAWHLDFLKGMLPCLEDESVGAVGPIIEPVIPKSRQNAQVITPWEVAAMRNTWNRNPKLKEGYAAGRWCWVLAGVSGVFRAQILKDPAFLQAFADDNWKGKKLDVGEDTFVTRWLQSHGWVIAIQGQDPETTVRRTIKTSPDFLLQMFRWERSTIQSHLRQATQVKQTYGSFFVARRTWARLLRPIITTWHIIAWTSCLWHYPVFTFFMIALYAMEAYSGYVEFFRQHPYMARYWWVAVGQDFFYIFQDYWCWCTLSNTSWEARKISAEEQNKVE